MNIVKFPNSILKTVCSDVELGSNEAKTLAVAMLRSMYDNQGMGLAAPQVGHAVNVIVYDVNSESKVMFNPKIISTSNKIVFGMEKCLSMLGVLIKVPRCDEVEVEYYDKDWNKKLKCFNGAESRCVQHEMDHLQGKMHIDRIGSRRNIVLMEYFKSAKKKFGKWVR